MDEIIKEIIGEERIEEKVKDRRWMIIPIILGIILIVFLVRAQTEHENLIIDECENYRIWQQQEVYNLYYCSQGKARYRLCSNLSSDKRKCYVETFDKTNFTELKMVENAISVNALEP